MKPFTLEVIKDYKLFYILKKIKANAPRIVLSHQQSHTNAVVEDCDLFQMADDSVLVAFKKSFQISNHYNYVASDGINEEIVPVQMFERIAPYYKIGPEIHQSGTFSFTNSTIEKAAVEDWRCDNQLYGPMTFVQINENNSLFAGLDDIEVYEPIFSINGVGHICYFKQKNRIATADEIINNFYTPMTCYTLPEIIKLVIEWSTMTGEPFHNYEEIAVKAKKFVDRLGITESIVANQPDMQIYNYLNGSTNARQRPDGVQPVSEELDKFIQNNLAHATFSRLISLNPTAWNLAEVLEYEMEYAKEEWDNGITHYRLPETAHGDLNSILEYSQEHIEETYFKVSYFFFKLYFGVLAQKKVTLDALYNEG